MSVKVLAIAAWEQNDGVFWVFFFDLIVEQSALKQNQSGCVARGKREESGTTAAVS